MPTEYPSILGSSGPAPSGGAPAPEPEPAPRPPAPPAGRGMGFRLVLVILVLAALGAVVLFLVRPGRYPTAADNAPAASAAPIPAPALIGSFGGNSVAPAGTKAWVVMVVDRIIESGGQTRFHYRMLRGGPGGEDGEGSYDPKSGEIRFGGNEESYVGRVARESDGQLVIMAQDNRRGFSIRLHHQ